MVTARGENDSETGYVPIKIPGKISLDIGKDFSAGFQKIPGTGDMGHEQDIGLGKVRTHKSFEHIRSQHDRVVVEQQPDLKILLGNGIISWFESVHGIIDQLHIIGEGDGLVDSRQTLEILFEPEDIFDMFRVFEITFLFASHYHIDGETPRKLLVNVMKVSAYRRICFKISYRICFHPDTEDTDDAKNTNDT